MECGGLSHLRTWKMINQYYRVKSQVRIQAINNTTTAAHYLQFSQLQFYARHYESNQHFCSYFIYLFNAYFIVYYVPSTVLGIGVTMMNKPDKSLLSWNLILQETCTINKKKNTHRRIRLFQKVLSYKESNRGNVTIKEKRKGMLYQSGWPGKA